MSEHSLQLEMEQVAHALDKSASSAMARRLMR